MKTIKMPKETLDKWLAALRSGEYKQTREKLYDSETGGFCCLGVLQHVLEGRVTPDEERNHELPSIKWLEKHGIEFSNIFNSEPTAQPYLPAINLQAAEANDEVEDPYEEGEEIHTYDFHQLADAIEQAAEGF